MTASLLSALVLLAAPVHHDHHAGDDGLALLEQSGRGFVGQFSAWDSWLLIAGGAGGIALLALDEADQQLAVERAGVLGPAGRKIGDVGGVVLTAPTVPVGAYVWGRSAGDEKLTHFALELGATQLIVTAEMAVISIIPFHHRPLIERGVETQSDQSFVNGALRGGSSFPSGHMIGVTVLAFKGWEHYGWRVGAPATAAAIGIGWARVEEGRHYVTDVVGTAALASVASLATRRTRGAWARAVLADDGELRLVLWPVLTPDSAGLWAVGAF